MTREQIIQTINGVSRTCRGAMLNTPDQIQQLVTEWQAIATTDTDGQVRFCRTLEAQMSTGYAALASAEAVVARVAELIYMHRDNCGFDFNQIITAGPWDGKTYSYTCPQCGNVGEYQAPYFEVNG